MKSRAKKLRLSVSIGGGLPRFFDALMTIGDGGEQQQPVTLAAQAFLDTLRSEAEKLKSKRNRRSQTLPGEAKRAA